MDTEIKNFRRRFEQKVREAMGFELPGLQKVSSSLQEVGNLPTRAYFPSRSRFGLGLALGIVWMAFREPEKRIFLGYCSYEASNFGRP